jgi:hypothetical protein
MMIFILTSAGAAAVAVAVTVPVVAFEAGAGVAMYRMTHPTAATAAGVTLLNQHQQTDKQRGRVS